MDAITIYLFSHLWKLSCSKHSVVLKLFYHLETKIKRKGRVTKKKNKKNDKINLFDLPGEPPPMLGGSKSMPAGFAGRFGDEATVPEAF